MLVGLWLAMVLVMSAGWLWQRHTRNATIVDALWSLGMAASAGAYAWLAPGDTVTRALVGILGALWGLRLGLHLTRRAFGEDEDGRYRYLRQHWHGHQGKFFAFFQAQALITALFALPFLAASWATPGAPHWAQVAGVLVWLISVGGEALADRQLARHRQDPANKGRTCRSGLWRYSRHPNYFFEWTHWFAYPLLAIGAPFAWLSWVGPLLMLVSLYRVTGIPFTEAQSLRSRGEDYRAYQRSTSAFIPWIPKRGSRHE
ncbi:DUF1295 domain-containing protein [Oleiagrimonas sp. C23AA]|uniref:DUF1295 domain-containing protein n=1 Tax=Oleiagrimonas sp. C23AA TaxID=2719047 RepID=UPI0014249286|nr:DUF1295 domain-containing protein [Oleiagrimonas sp. C23AA]NII11714.1 DUF1295 domain-containing protein [Oleiagrimonas sp. C23AA]